MKIKITPILTLIIFLGFILYWNSNYHIMSHNWKATEQSEIGDFLMIQPNRDDSIKGRTLQLNGKPHCKIIFCFNETLILSDLEGKHFIKYIGK
jgi:hypothetical protein